MSGQPAFHADVAQDDSHVSGRHPCEVHTTCQPPSSWCKDPWPATIRDIATTGLSLTLARRFERGSGLAIELPCDGSTTTVLARVTQVKAHPEGGWLLACDFISELSDEEVHQVLQFDPLSQATLPDSGSTCPGKPAMTISGVLFQAKVRQGEHLRWYVKRLDLSGDWPPPEGKIVSMSVGGLETAPIELRIKSCQLFGSFWIVDCRLKTVPSNEVLRALTSRAG